MAEASEPDKIMFVNRDRVFYYGLLGARMKPRRPGGITFYLAERGDVRVRLGSGGWTAAPCIVLPHYCSHQVAIDCDRVFCLMFEPERLRPEDQAWLLAAGGAGPAQADWIARVRAALMPLAAAGGAQRLGTAGFDRLLLGTELPARRLDPRIDLTLDRFEQDLGEVALSAEECARQVGLSASRFLHLFKQETGASYRNMRMWKRARRFLEHATHDRNLTEVALDLGYPDSSHFSHSIRRTYGLKPRSIREGSRGLRLVGARCA
ncbi:helix-turn-helix transcriptional regulator [Pseudodonghicola flavimaris]|uniref:Helix-turn-helix transcriptional regulator n=1 Tax=Pseudodonghicola flavimaris TaxID=3050036 RepID=A0ABT7EUL3_9RHOB|nr:helix-turn-helix transcriptional regulator [Pseudodonghicola flavimaris]MDK3016041.1 helix-turn-helix transcriptional regulator [Pseudodonghicola flavimaris]